jgi:hypothetical protein
MPRDRPRSCKLCGAREADGYPISWAGYCQEHGELVIRANRDNLRAGEGPFYDHWERRSYLALVKRLNMRQPTTS